MTFDLNQYRDEAKARRARLLGLPPAHPTPPRSPIPKSQVPKERKLTGAKGDAQVIRHMIAAAHHITMAEIDSPRLARRAVFARQTAMAHVYCCTKLSLPSVGKMFGERDHTTVLHAVRVFEHDLALMVARVAVRLEARAKDASAPRYGKLYTEMFGQRQGCAA